MMPYCIVPIFYILLNIVDAFTDYKLKDKVSWSEEKESEIKTVFRNGKLVKEYSLSEIRNRLNDNRKIHRTEEKVA